MTTSPTPPVIHLTPRPKRHVQHTPAPSDPHDFWWSTSAASGSSSSHATATPSPSVLPPSQSQITSLSTAIPPTSDPGTSASQTLGPSGLNSIPPSSPSDTLYTFTSTIPVTIIGPSATVVSLSQVVYTSTAVATALPESQTISADLQSGPVCIGDGLDASSIGLLSTIIVPTVIGLLLWVSSS